MIFIPTTHEYDSTLKQGAVFYATIPEIHPTEPHYLIVLNKQPKNDDFIFFVNITSDIELMEQFSRGESPETLVRLDSAQYQRLNRPSIINCNILSSAYKDELPHSKAFKACDGVNDDLLTAVLRGVEISRFHSEDRKKLFR